MDRNGAEPCRLSVVVPCFNEAEVLLAFYERTASVLHDAVGDDYEIVLVNDGSRDGTWEMIGELAERDPRVVGVNLSRNFGHQLALTAGLDYASGDLVLILDADLQDPPELLPRMMALIDEGADVVYGQRTERFGETRFKVAMTRGFYRLLGKIANVDIPLDAGDFRLMRRRVVDALNDMPEQQRFVRGMVAWLGFTQVPLPYQRPARHAGTSKYSLVRLIRLALDGITSFSVWPLRLALFAGVAFCLVALGLLIYALASWAFIASPPGWTSTMVAITLVGGMQLICVGLLSEYLGRVYMEVKRRPHFIVREVRARQRRRDTIGGRAAE
ncbi:MAG: glycosyltransferase family 2 protein [Stellaceae bacterium]